MNSLALALGFFGLDVGFPPGPGTDDAAILGTTILGAFILGQG